MSHLQCIQSMHNSNRGAYRPTEFNLCSLYRAGRIHNSFSNLGIQFGGGMMKEKKAHGVQLLLRMVVRDPDGKIISDTGRKPSKSFVIQFLEFIYAMGPGLPRNATDINGAETQIYDHDAACSLNFRMKGLLATDDMSIIIGTGDTAVANTDFKLETQLTEGVGAGNISYGVGTVTPTAVVGANVDLELKRPFTNLTGSTITVKEVGIYADSFWGGIHCIIRDVLGASVDVPDKCSLSVIYTLRTTV